MKLLDFSDELLIIIFSFLNTEDVVSLSQTCIRLGSLLCDRKITRRTDLRRAYSIHKEVLHIFMKPDLRREHIHTLNLTSCYWLHSSDIYNVSINIPNIYCLFLQDTQLAFKHLFWILKSNNTIRKLSWSFNIVKENQPKLASEGWMQQKCLIDTLRNKLAQLEYLNLSVRNNSMKYLHQFLTYCKCLHELRLNLYSASGSSPIVFYEEPQHLEFKSLESLTVILQEPNEEWNSFVSYLLTACNASNLWKKIWINPDINISDFYKANFQSNLQAISISFSVSELEEILNLKNICYLDCSYLRTDDREKFISLQPSLYNSSVTHLSCGSSQFLHFLPHGLEHLFISANYCEYLRKPAHNVLLNPMPNLMYLSIPFCTFMFNLQTYAFNNRREKMCYENPSCSQANLSQVFLPPTTEYNLKASYSNAEKVNDQVKCRAREKNKLKGIPKISQNKEQEKKAQRPFLCSECKSKLKGTKEVTEFNKTLQTNKRIILNSLLNSTDSENNLDFEHIYEDSNYNNSDSDKDISIIKKSHTDTMDNTKLHLNVRMDEHSCGNYLYSEKVASRISIGKERKTNQQITDIMPALVSSPLAGFTHCTPNLRHLELKNCNRLCNQWCTLDDMAMLHSISNWKKLESLFLNDLPISDSSFLVQIGKNCPNIKQFSLILNNWNQSTHLVKYLTEMLPSFNFLQDLRLEYHQTGHLNRLLQALCNCTKLQRIVIVNQYNDEPPLLKNIYSLIEDCKSLVFLYFNIVSLTQKMIMDFNHHVQGRFKMHRPALWAHIEGQRNIYTIFPEAHFDMVSYNSPLKIIPPSGE